MSDNNDYETFGEIMKSAKLKGDRFYIKRLSDGSGDSGGMFKALKWPEGKDRATIDELEQVGESGEIRVGCRVHCGSTHTRTFGQDWWLTTEVTEILEINADNTKVVFKTYNSIYEAGTI